MAESSDGVDYTIEAVREKEIHLTESSLRNASSFYVEIVLKDGQKQVIDLKGQIKIIEINIK